MLRLTRHGEERVKAGNYWDFSTGERVHLEQEAILPGDASKTYLKCHPVLLLLVAPFIGLVYAIFLPLIGMAMLIWIIGEKTTSGVRLRAWKTASFSWHPSEAYFAGKKRKVRQETKAEK